LRHLKVTGVTRVLQTETENTAIYPYIKRLQRIIYNFFFIGTCLFSG